MSYIDDIKTQLDKIQSLKKDLKPELGAEKQVSQLPKEIRKKINEITIIPEITGGGLESVDYVWENLLLAEVIANKEIKQQEEAERPKPAAQINQPKPVPLAQSQPQPQPQTKPISAIPTLASLAETPQPQPQSQQQAKINSPAPTPK